MSQTERLLELLERFGERGVTPLDALEHVGSFRLAARVKDLRDAGHVIRSERARTATGKTVARYVLEPPAGQRALPW